VAFFNFLIPLFITLTSYRSISPKLGMVPALMTKMMPTINAINYALRGEMFCRGIWQCLSPQRSRQDRTQ
uniref:Uncharacterized protein n=1 Tax=Sciurus vulgaris TaxID=55149 RepID=A0A8D2CTC1_SCIVU